ncbi:MAG TPA: porin family protein [Cyclobacteriaceae bacterium]|nr:porin family protein [Cyclobacteriaceae bacterium]HNU43484.1 porin family protein [Cyclobacteriaceae bacterium]
MQVTYIRNKFAVFGYQVVLVVALMALPLLTQAQVFKWARQNNPNYDERLISYGFMIGLHTSAYQVKYAPKFITQQFDTVHSVMAQFSPGFSLGFLVNYRVNEFVDLRIMPKAGFYTHRLQYNYTDETSQQQFVETTHVELPLLLKYKSMRRGNVRMYMVGGITPGFELSGKNDIQASSALLDIRKNNLQLETGLGFDFYFPLFKFSQEIRFARGIVNMMGNRSSVYSDPIQRLNTNTISVYFIFQ